MNYVSSTDLKVIRTTLVVLKFKSWISKVNNSTISLFSSAKYPLQVVILNCFINQFLEDTSLISTFYRNPAPNGSCSFRTWLNWQAQRNRSCSPFGRCCPNGQRFSLSAMKCFNPQDKDKLRLGLNHTKCDPDNQVFCDRQQVCLPKHVNCTDPVMFDYFSVGRFANKSGRFTSNIAPTPLKFAALAYQATLLSF